MLQQWHVKDPGHSAESVGGRLNLNMHTPLTQWSWSGLTLPLSRHSVGPVRKRAHTQFVMERSVTVISARWAIVDWSWPKEWNECVQANFYLKQNKKKCRQGMNCWTFSQNHCKQGKSHKKSHTSKENHFQIPFFQNSLSNVPWFNDTYKQASTEHKKAQRRLFHNPSAENGLNFKQLKAKARLKNHKKKMEKFLYFT